MSHPTLGKRVCLSLFLIFVLIILGSNCFAAISVSSISPYVTQAYQGSTGNIVLTFILSYSGETVTDIKIKNNSSDVPFGSSSIERIAVYGNVALTQLKGESHPPDGAAASQLISLSGLASGSTYYLVYDIDSRADASEVGGTERYASVEVESAIGSISGEVAATGSAYSIKILPNGLTYDQSFVQSIVPDTAVGQGFTDVSMLKFRLRASNQDVTLNSITISSGDGAGVAGNFAPNVTVRESFVKKISIYEDTNNNEYFDGFGSVDVLVGNRDLGNGNTQYEASVAISNSSGIPDSSTRMFFVFYDIGNGVADGTTVLADLRDAVGLGSQSGVVQLNGVLPTGAQASLTITSVNAHLVTASEIIPAYPIPYYAIAGERHIPMIQFTLDTNGSFSNAKVIIKNSGGSFLASGEGVSKITLYRDDGGTQRLIGATASFLNNTTAEITGVYLPSGLGIDYYVYYDLSVGASIASDIQCQIQNIESSGVVFGGTLPAPQPAANFPVTPAILAVYNVVENVDSVEPDQEFPLEIVVRNVRNTGGNNVMLINSVRPAFYNQDIGGTDISPEYSYTIHNPNYRITVNTTVTYNFTVKSSGLKTDGLVIIDAFIDYKDVQFIANKPQSVYLSRYKSGGGYSSAALGNNVGAFTAKGADEEPSFDLKLPSYIASMNIIPYGYYPEEPFLNADIVPKNSKLKIYLANRGEGIDLSTIMIYSGSTLLAKGGDYLIDETDGIITLLDMGEKSATLKIDGYSGDAAIETAYIRYYIHSGFVVKDFFAGPSPYKPSAGDMYFSFQLSKPAEIKIYLYDSAAQLVWESESIEFDVGYNEIAWDGTLDVGGTVGRGVYLVRIIAKNDDEDEDVIEKTKFAVF